MSGSALPGGGRPTGSYPETLVLYLKRTSATVSAGLTPRVRFRYSRLKEAALFAADAMGFQSPLVWKLLKSGVFVVRSSNRSSSIQP